MVIKYDDVLKKLGKSKLKKLDKNDLNYLKGMLEYVSLTTGRLDNCVSIKDNIHMKKLYDLKIITTNHPDKPNLYFFNQRYAIKKDLNDDFRV